MLREKFIAENAYIIKEERSQINNLKLCPKKLEREKQAIPTASRRKEIIRIRPEINEIKNKKTKPVKPKVDSSKTTKGTNFYLN